MFEISTYLLLTNEHCEITEIFLVQALKSLTLVRLNKYQEAESLLKEVRECKPSDESTLLALTACYRELKKRNFISCP